MPDKPMNAEERAAKIVEEFADKTFYLEETGDEWLKERIADQIFEAEREAGKDCNTCERIAFFRRCENCVEEVKAEAKSEGFRAAREKARNICFEVVDKKIGIYDQVLAFRLGHSGGAYTCADLIYAMEPDNG